MGSAPVRRAAQRAGTKSNRVGLMKVSSKEKTESSSSLCANSILNDHFESFLSFLNGRTQSSISPAKFSSIIGMDSQKSVQEECSLHERMVSWTHDYEIQNSPEVSVSFGLNAEGK
jgi:hypothetical protein